MKEAVGQVEEVAVKMTRKLERQRKCLKKITVHVDPFSTKSLTDIFLLPEKISI